MGLANGTDAGPGRIPDGQVESGPYVDGKQHGRWHVAFPNGQVTDVEFVHGVRQEP